MEKIEGWKPRSRDNQGAVIGSGDSSGVREDEEGRIGVRGEHQKNERLVHDGAQPSA